MALPGSGSDALASFVAGNGDVLLAYENDSIAARASGEDVDYILPDDTLLIQNPAALTTDASPAAKDFLKFQLSKAGQTDLRQGRVPSGHQRRQRRRAGGQRPERPLPGRSRPSTRIDKTFGGWDKANPKYFDEDNGIITKIISGLNVGE